MPPMLTCQLLLRIGAHIHTSSREVCTTPRIAAAARGPSQSAATKPRSTSKARHPIALHWKRQFSATHLHTVSTFFTACVSLCGSCLCQYPIINIVTHPDFFHCSRAATPAPPGPPCTACPHHALQPPRASTPPHNRYRFRCSPSLPFSSELSSYTTASRNWATRTAR